MKHIYRTTFAVTWALRLVLIVLPQALTNAFAADALTLPEALAIAQKQSPLLRAQDAAMLALREMGAAAGQNPEPMVRFGINNLPVSGADRYSLSRDFMTMRSIGIAQEFVRNEKREARTARLEREADVTAANRDMILVALQRDVALAWLSRHYLERMQGVLIAQRTEARLQVDAADLTYRTAKGSQADVFAARIALEQIADRIGQGERAVANATVRLARWLGEAATRPLGLLPSLDKVPVSSELALTHLKGHPGLRVLEQQEQVTLAEATIARESKRGDWTVDLMFSQRGAAFSNMVSINFSIPLPWGQTQRQDREVSAKLALAEQLRMQRDDLRREHLAELNAMLLDWQTNRDRLLRYEKNLIPLSKERVTANLVAYRVGTGSLTSLLEARRMQLDMELDAIRLAMETATVWGQLTFFVLPHQIAVSTPTEAKP